MCPASQIQFANKYGDILAQHGTSCYTVANYKASWEHAEDICQRHSGHLLHILNKDENDFITNLLTSQFSHSVWIGLHDIDREEHFKWTSGELAFESRHVSWGHAYDLCQMHSGHPLHILNKDENDFITNLLNSQFSHSVWIGLHDLDREEHFKWTSGQLTFSSFLLGFC